MDHDYSPLHQVGVFLDAANIIISCSDVFGLHPDFCTILKTALCGRENNRAIAYYPNEGSTRAQAMMDALKDAGFKIVSKDIKSYSDGRKKGDMDVDITVDVMNAVCDCALDVVVLITGDGDFMPLVKDLMAKGIIVKIMSVLRTTSSELLRLVQNNHIEIGPGLLRNNFTNCHPEETQS